MIDERTRELIQSSVDGELDDGDRAELEAALERSETARHYHSELNRLADFLDKIPDVEPPAGLHDRILERISLPRRSSLKRILSFSELPAFMRYGFAAAAGLLMAVVIYENGRELAGDGDFSNMVGTMTMGGPEGQTRLLDSFAFEKDGASGAARFERRNGAFVVEIELDSPDEIGFRVDFRDDGLALNAFAQLESQLDSVVYSDRVVQGSGRGRQRFAVLLHRDAGTETATGASIDVAFSRHGKVFREGRLDPGW